MPHLRHLILADDLVYDISPLENLKELEWLELFNTAVQDPTPLLGCTALRDLNVCYISTPPDTLFETLSQMTWLRRLWCTGTYMSDAQVKALREALPNTEVWCSPGDESTGGTWRYDEDYYDMRDAFHMYYMDIKGNTVERMTEDELAAVHKNTGVIDSRRTSDAGKKNDKSKIVARVLVICAAALIVLAAAAGVILSRRYIRLGQQFIPVNAAMLDLRGAGLTDLAPLDRCTALTELDVRENKLSAEALDEFRAKHPGCRVLYSVYLNDEPHESGTESLTLEDLPNDWENLRLSKISARSP